MKSSVLDHTHQKLGIGMLNRIFKRLEKMPSTELMYLLKYARKVPAERRHNATTDLQRLVLRPIQSLHMLDAYYKPKHGAIESLNPWTDIGLMYIPGTGMDFSSFIQNHRFAEEELPAAKLGRDMLLPTCWSSVSIINVLGAIGDGRESGAWKQDSNHSLILFYPLNIWWVAGGNHSIMQGIINGEGEVKADEAYDLSPLYEYMCFDGRNWVDTKSGKIIGTPRYKELGYVYELGRILKSEAL